MLALQAPEAGRRLARETTLDEVIARAWHGLNLRQVVECPVCGEPMAPGYAGAARPLDGLCQDCGAILS